MGMFCPSPIPHHGSPPPLCLLDRRTLFMRSFSLRNGRSTSVPRRPPHRDLQKRLRPNESIRPRAPFQSATKTSQMSSPKEAFAHLPPRKAWDHAIELHPDAKLPRGRTFPLSPAEQKELDAFLREN